MGAEATTVKIPADSVELEGILTLPKRAKGIVVFAHGAGSSRFSPRNILVATVFHKHGIATLLFDLLTEEEDSVYENRFNIDLLTERLMAVTTWLIKKPETKGLKIGYFGSSTGSASALRAAAVLGKQISAIVSRGGRPDITGKNITRVRTPTLFIVGGADYGVIELNEQAYAQLNCKKELKIVAGATHLFEESGALEEVARLAADWFERYLD